MKRFLTAFFLFWLATAAWGWPTEGMIGNLSNFRYSELNIENNRTVTMRFDNDTTGEVVLEARLLFLDPTGNIVAETEFMSVPLAASGSAEAKTTLARGTVEDALNADTLAWGNLNAVQQDGP